MRPVLVYVNNQPSLRYQVFISDKNAGTTNWKLVGTAGLFNEALQGSDHGLETTTKAAGTIPVNVRCSITSIMNFVGGGWQNVNDNAYAAADRLLAFPVLTGYHQGNAEYNWEAQ